MELSKKDALLGIGLTLLLATAVVRLAVPDRSRIRPVSVNGLDIPNERIPAGATITREVSWAPPADVYIIGWSYRIGARPADPVLFLLHGETRIFSASGADPANLGFLQAGAGYRLAKGQRLTLRYVLANAGPEGETRGASALVYFVPIEGN